MMQHQIVQSPARLGLTNPTSPSLQSPNPPKFPTPQHHQHHSSSTLLSLLPPLPRAQSLLLQMASLSSKLFDVSPHRSLWLSSFRGSLPTFLSSQLQSHPPPPLSSSPSTSKDIISLFTLLQTQLFEAVAELQEILDLQDAKHKIVREIRSRDSALLCFAHKLKDAERVLDILVDDYADYTRPKRPRIDGHGDGGDLSASTVASKLKLSDILSYAHKISYTTFAPLEFGANQAPLRGALPPAPQEEQMRASQLYAFADLDVGLPKSIESKETTIEAIIEPMPLVDTIPLHSLLPPAGWKPGMPVDLPVPPPGWQPGDPITLPPLESLPVPRMEEQQLRPAAPQGFQKPPEPIQVRHVQLDILDQDDDSSDYSSEEGSSDDDD
ncbi:Med4 domain-containing protein [Cephalotus follicularis]|uniref:Mediator of RNA polymerase II transcription subunit 4 n=1 Tax=Cephalotus follicularis TaxID=3775 RepID=A0A1Q3CVB0_CEPFO|nr:Med4 domain-containing protein [Cephalotus follicularis]